MGLGERGRERALREELRAVARGYRDRHKRIGVVPRRRVVRIRPERMEAPPVPGVVARERAQHRGDPLELRLGFLEAVF